MIIPSYELSRNEDERMVILNCAKCSSIRSLTLSPLRKNVKMPTDTSAYSRSQRGVSAPLQRLSELSIQSEPSVTSINQVSGPKTCQNYGNEHGKAEELRGAVMGEVICSFFTSACSGCYVIISHRPPRTEFAAPALHDLPAFVAVHRHRVSTMYPRRRA